MFAAMSAEVTIDVSLTNWPSTSARDESTVPSQVEAGDPSMRATAAFIVAAATPSVGATRLRGARSKLPSGRRSFVGLS